MPFRRGPTPNRSEVFNTGPFFHYWAQKFGRRSNTFPLIIEREAYETQSPDVDLYLYGGSWAVEMRMRNENGSFTAWQAFSANAPWTLSAGNGFKTVTAEIRNGSGTVRSNSDSILLEDTSGILFGDGFESGNVSAWSSAVP